MPHLARHGFRAIALDLPGFGHSPMPDWKISIPAYGRLVDDFVRILGLNECVIVGNSMGGFIAAEVAIAEPQWIDRLALVSAAGISHATLRREPAFVWARAIAALTPMALRLNSAGLRRERIRRMAFQGVMRHPDRIRPELLWEYFVRTAGKPGFTPAVMALAGYDFRDRLERIAPPTLIVWGRDDLVVPAEDAAGYEEGIPDSRLHIFDDCGHVPMAERPIRFNRLLTRFVSAEDPEVSR
jgi:pimeloyl-ACP methyl ester carboxylesterase